MLIGFDPIVSNDPLLLILGSMPSVTSLQQQEYYGFKQNRFWKILHQMYDMPIETYEQKCTIILQQQLALWDVIGQCEREGSLDSAIRNEVVNDIEGLLQAHPTIKKVICNGRKSYDLYQKHFSKLSIECVYVPSTSNANRSISQDALFVQWMDALNIT